MNKIKVKTTNSDTPLYLTGGEFEQLVREAKYIKGRRYDPSSKTWIIPLTTEKFRETLTEGIQCLSPQEVNDLDFNNKLETLKQAIAWINEQAACPNSQLLTTLENLEQQESRYTRKYGSRRSQMGRNQAKLLTEIAVTAPHANP